MILKTKPSTPSRRFQRQKEALEEFKNKLPKKLDIPRLSVSTVVAKKDTEQ